MDLKPGQMKNAINKVFRKTVFAHPMEALV